MNIRFRPLIFLGLLFAWTLPSRAVENRKPITERKDRIRVSL